jgi:hypothetical protein
MIFKKNKPFLYPLKSHLCKVHHLSLTGSKSSPLYSEKAATNERRTLEGVFMNRSVIAVKV